jgi:hypothetical protein
MIFAILLWSAGFAGAAVKAVPPGVAASKLAAVGGLLASALSVPALELSPGKFYSMPLSAPAGHIPLSDLEKIAVLSRRAVVPSEDVRLGGSLREHGTHLFAPLDTAREVLSPLSLAELESMPAKELEVVAGAVFDGMLFRSGGTDVPSPIFLEERRGLSEKMMRGDGFESLDRFLHIHRDEIDAKGRLSLIRELAEMLPYAKPKSIGDMSMALHKASRHDPEASMVVSLALIRLLPRIKSTMQRHNIGRRLINAAARHPAVRVALIEVLRQRLGLPSPDEAFQFSLVKRLPTASPELTEDIALSLALTLGEDPAGRQALWRRLVDVFMENGSDVQLKESGRRRLRSASEERLLRGELPTLHALTRDPSRMGRFVSLLAFLRMLYPYYWPNDAEEPPAAWSKERGLAFEWNELRIIPVSESFRRFIIEKARGDYAVELKIPGQIAGRVDINDEHFTLADQLWRDRPDDPGVVRPVMLSRYEGRLRLYGMPSIFIPTVPLSVMIFRYEDGKRLSNAEGLLASLAKRRNVPVDEVRNGVRAQVAAASVRLHRERWSGSADGNDMHPENIRVTPDGRAVLVGDFGAFKRLEKPLPAVDRKKETAMLLGNYSANRDPEYDPTSELYDLGRADAAAVYPDAVRLLSKGTRSARTRSRIEREVRRELGLAP